VFGASTSNADQNDHCVSRSVFGVKYRGDFYCPEWQNDSEAGKWSSRNRHLGWFQPENKQEASVQSKVVLVLLLALSIPSRTMAQPNGPLEWSGNADQSVCRVIEDAAQASALPVGFFTRLIWQESRFRADEVGPVTRTGERAEGIAQFMPGTAAEHNLHQPFDPAEALPKSGELLAALRGEFGNLGLAAAAYNAGPQRVRDYLYASRELPAETRNYVLAITGHPIEEWKAIKDSNEINSAEPEGARVTCFDLLVKLERETNSVVIGWQQRNVPSWCRALRRPNINVCGSVHLATLAVRPAVHERSRVHLSRTPPH
jgi:hypothetical protein